MSWHKIVMGPHELLAGQHLRLRERFATLLAEQPQSGVAIYYSREESGFVTYYLNPACSEAGERLLARFGAVPCTPPLAHEVEQLLG